MAAAAAVTFASLREAAVKDFEKKTGRDYSARKRSYYRNPKVRKLDRQYSKRYGGNIHLG